MLAKRIVPCLDVKDGRTVKGVNFVGLRDAGDPVELAAKYAAEGADELVFLDITATHEKRKTTIDMVRRVAETINIPFTVGGGIGCLEDVHVMLQNGADKVAVNSAAVRSPQLLNDIAAKFGNQCLVLAVDAKQTPTGWKVFLNGGRLQTEIDLFTWVVEAEKRGAGEILFTSMDNDGTKNGFSIEPLRQIAEVVNIPVIASGGAGNMQHFEEVFTENVADAALAASIFHFGEVPIPALKQFLVSKNIPVRL